METVWDPARRSIGIRDPPVRAGGGCAEHGLADYPGGAVRRTGMDDDAGVVAGAILVRLPQPQDGPWRQRPVPGQVDAAGDALGARLAVAPAHVGDDPVRGVRCGWFGAVLDGLRGGRAGRVQAGQLPDGFFAEIA